MSNPFFNEAKMERDRREAGEAGWGAPSSSQMNVASGTAVMGDQMLAGAPVTDASSADPSTFVGYDEVVGMLRDIERPERTLVDGPYGSEVALRSLGNDVIGTVRKGGIFAVRHRDRRIANRLVPGVVGQCEKENVRSGVNYESRRWTLRNGQRRVHFVGARDHAAVVQ